MYRKVKELDQKENNWNMIVDQKLTLKIWGIYVEEFYNRANRPENLNVEPEEEEEVDEDHARIITQSASLHIWRR
jgi:hypothetical protein